MATSQTPQFIPTPPMRIQQIIEQDHQNRVISVTSGSLPYPYPVLPSYSKPFDNLPSPYFTPYKPYYQPYYYRPYYPYRY